MVDKISDFLGYVGTERGFTSKTVEAYKHDLGKFDDFLVMKQGHGYNLADIDAGMVKSYLHFVADRGNKAVTRGRKLATLKSFFKYLASDGVIKVDPTAQLVMPKVKQQEPSYLTEQEYKRLLDAVKENSTPFFQLRDTAIVTVFLGMGLRLSELVALNVGDVNFEDGTIKVTRKGNHERILPGNDEVMRVISRYLDGRNKIEHDAPLFLSMRNQRIDSASVWRVVKKHLKQAKIVKTRLSPHTLRHTFATTLLKQGENILTIKELMSHRNLRTTERYLHINNDDLKAAVGRIDMGVK